MKSLFLTRPLACFDIEATGISPQADRIIELAIIKMHPDGTNKSYHFLVNPEIPIPLEASNIHGFTDNDVFNCPPFSKIAENVDNILKDCDFAGFNVLRYDIPMLSEEMARANIHFDLENRKIVDAQRIYHQKEPRHLAAALSFYCNEKHVNAHGAMADVSATIRVIEAQINKYNDVPNDIPSLDIYCNPRNPSWVDRSGKLKWINKRISINFGKKKGIALKTLIEDNSGFINWLLRSDFPDDVKKIVRQGQQGCWPEPPPDAI